MRCVGMLDVRSGEMQEAGSSSSSGGKRGKAKGSGKGTKGSDTGKGSRAQSRRSHDGGHRGGGGGGGGSAEACELDWESTDMSGFRPIDIVVATDCVFNVRLPMICTARVWESISAVLHLAPPCMINSDYVLSHSIYSLHLVCCRRARAGPGGLRAGVGRGRTLRRWWCHPWSTPCSCWRACVAPSYQSFASSASAACSSQPPARDGPSTCDAWEEATPRGSGIVAAPWAAYIELRQVPSIEMREIPG
jgi:hypothetical protein